MFLAYFELLPQDNRISLVDYVVAYYLRNIDQVRNGASIVVLRCDTGVSVGLTHAIPTPLRTLAQRKVFSRCLSLKMSFWQHKSNLRTYPKIYANLEKTYQVRNPVLLTISV